MADDKDKKAKAEAAAKTKAAEKAAKNDKVKADEGKPESEKVNESEKAKAPEKAKADPKNEKKKHPLLEEFTHRKIGEKVEVLVHCRHTLTDGVRKFKPSIVVEGKKEKKLKPHWIPESLAIAMGPKYLVVVSPDELKKKKKDDDED